MPDQGHAGVEPPRAGSYDMADAQTRASATVAVLLEMDDERYIVTRSKLRPDTAARIERDYAAVFGQKEGPIGYTVGGRKYDRDENGQWWEERKQRDPKWWTGFNYAFVAGSTRSGENPIILLRLPRVATSKQWHSALGKLITAVGIDRKGGMAVDGADEKSWKSGRWPKYDLRGNNFVKVK